MRRLVLTTLLGGCVAVFGACNASVEPMDGGGPGGGGGGGGGGATGGGAGGGGGAVPAVRPAIDVVSGAARVVGGGLVLDVQVGGAGGAFSVSGGGRTLQGQVAIRP